MQGSFSGMVFGRQKSGFMSRKLPRALRMNVGFWDGGETAKVREFLSDPGQFAKRCVTSEWRRYDRTHVLIGDVQPDADRHFGLMVAVIIW